MSYPEAAQPQARPKYTNHDVEADFHNLHAIAVRYLMTYNGVFTPLRSARHIIQTGDLLSIDQLRVVCNCLIQDMRVINMPEPIGHTLRFNAQEGGGAKIIKMFKDADDGYEDDVPRVEKPIVLQMKSRPNSAKPFWYSTHPNAYLIHIIHNAIVLYHTPAFYENRLQYDMWATTPPYMLRFQTKVEFMCGKRNSRIPKGNVAVSASQIKELLSGGRRWCGGCEDYWSSNPENPALPT